MPRRSEPRQSTGIHHTHTGHGRRDQLSAGERTRILRMLRDEGGRLADEDSQVLHRRARRAKDYDFDFDDVAGAGARAERSAGAAMLRPDVPAKPAVVVGSRRRKRATRCRAAHAAAPCASADR